MNKELKIGSLFSGYGGLDLAVTQAFPGSTVAWHCEFDEAPSAILNYHYPNVPNLHDVTQVDWKNVEPVDIITGGSPCQDLSTAGRRAGMSEGTRSNLWVNMCEAIATIQPRLVVWENVQGVLSAEAYSASDVEPEQGLLGGGDGHLRALGRVLGDLTEIGYDARWTTVRASDIGAPHRRARVFLIAYPTDTGCIGLQTAEWTIAANTQVARAVSGGGTLPNDGSIYGRYEPAVRRWETKTGTIAPPPTDLNPKGEPRLNVEFVEWMMGLPKGWVTGVPGLSRAHQLKAIGNGVVPQQAVYAIQQITG